MNGWSCAPKHGPGHFTVLKTLFFWIVWSFSKTFELMAGPRSPKHGLVLFTVLRNRFVWMFCSRLKTFKIMAGPRFPTSSVTAQLISRRWRIISFWCYADMQQRSNKRMVVLSQTRSRSFHGVENSFRLDGMKLFKNIRTHGWAVLSQTRPSSFHGVEESICLDVLQPCKTFKFMAGPRSPTSPVTAQLISRRWRIVSFWCYVDYLQPSNERIILLPQSRSIVFHGVKKVFRLDGIKFFKNIRTDGLVVLPQTRLSSFHGEEPFRLDVMQPDKNI